MSPEAAYDALRAHFGEPATRSISLAPRWLVTGPHGGAWFELRIREGVPMLMVSSERGCTSEICDMLFLELRSARDVALLARKMATRHPAGRRP
jgi:hypothetical protein